MRKVTTVEAVEALIGKPSPIIQLKATDTVDQGCRGVLAYAPVAGFGFRDHDAVAHTTLVGGAPGFAHVESPTRLSFEIPPDSPRPGHGGASMMFLLPGVGETLRLNGSVTGVHGTRLILDLHEAWVHCAKCVRRSGLWNEVPTEPTQRDIAMPREHGAEGRGPLAQPMVAEFLAESPFVIVSSWDSDGRGDTSPKGDPPGFLRILDDHTLAIPDRKGNKRADTVRNLMTCAEVSLAALVPACDNVLHMSGTASVTDSPELLSTMALQDKPPHAALVVHIERAEIRRSDAVRTSRLWDQSASADPSRAPDMMKVATQHLARNKAHGATASMARVLSKGLAASPKMARRAIDASYRKDLKDEGY